MRVIKPWILVTLLLLETSQCRFTELDRILPDQTLPLHHPFAYQLGPVLGPKSRLPVLRNGYYKDQFYRQQKGNSLEQYAGLPSLTAMHLRTIRNHGVLSPDFTSKVRYQHHVESQNTVQPNVTKNTSNTRHGIALFLDFENYEAVVPPTDVHLRDNLEPGSHIMSDGSINITDKFSTANSVAVDMGGTHSEPLVETGLFSRISVPVHTVSDTGDQINQVKIGTGGMDTTSTVYDRLGIPPSNQLDIPSAHFLGKKGETRSTLSMLPPHPRKFHRNRTGVETPTGKTAQLRVPTIRSFAHSVFLESSRLRPSDFHSPASDPRGNLNELEQTSRQISLFINRPSRPEVRGGILNTEVHSLTPGRQSEAFHSSVPTYHPDDQNLLDNKLIMKTPTPVLDTRNRESMTSDLRRKSDSISGHHISDLPNDLPYLSDNIVQERSVWSLATRKHRTKSATSTNIVISPTATDPLVSDFWWLSNNTTRNEPTTPTESSGFNRNGSHIVTKTENSGPLELVSHQNPDQRSTHLILDFGDNKRPRGSSIGFRREDDIMRFPFPNLQQLNSLGDQRDSAVDSQFPDTNELANLKVPVKDIPPKKVVPNQISNRKPDQSFLLQAPTLGDGQGAFNLPWIQEVEKSTSKHSEQQSFNRNSINYTKSSLGGYTVGPGHVFRPVNDTNNFTVNSMAQQGNSSSGISLHIYMTQDRKQFDVASTPISKEMPVPKLTETMFHKETHANSLLLKEKSNLTQGDDSYRAWLSPPLDRQLSAKKQRTEKMLTGSRRNHTNKMFFVTKPVANVERLWSHSNAERLSQDNPEVENLQKSKKTNNWTKQFSHDLETLLSSNKRQMQSSVSNKSHMQSDASVKRQMQSSVSNKRQMLSDASVKRQMQSSVGSVYVEDTTSSLSPFSLISTPTTETDHFGNFENVSISYISSLAASLRNEQMRELLKSQSLPEASFTDVLGPLAVADIGDSSFRKKLNTNNTASFAVSMFNANSSLNISHSNSDLDTLLKVLVAAETNNTESFLAEQIRNTVQQLRENMRVDLKNV